MKLSVTRAFFLSVMAGKSPANVNHLTFAEMHTLTEGKILNPYVNTAAFIMREYECIYLEIIRFLCILNCQHKMYYIV